MSAHDTLSQRTVTEVEDNFNPQDENQPPVSNHPTEANEERIEPEEVILDLDEQSDLVGKEYCLICFEPLSRSRTYGVTYAAAAKASGMRIMIEAKSDTKEVRCATARRVRGSACAVARRRCAPPVARARSSS